MRVPFKSETDAFRVAVALGLLAGSSVLVAVVTSVPYGVVLAAAGVTAGLVFELAGREGTGSALLQAAHAAHRHGSSHGKRHILVVASEKLRGEGLRKEILAAGGADVQLDVLAPVFSSRSHFWASDFDSEREEASDRLEASLEWAAEQGFTASGEVGDSDPLVAVEDELRDFGADEVVVAVHPPAQTSWLADRMLRHVSSELDVPVRQVAVGDDEGSAARVESRPEWDSAVPGERRSLRHRLLSALVAAALVGAGGVIVVVAAGGG